MSTILGNKTLNESKNFSVQFDINEVFKVDPTNADGTNNFRADDT